MKKILILNTLPIINFGKENKTSKTAGNQTLYNTLKGYSENGFEVYMITFYNVPKFGNPFPNVKIYRSKSYLFYHVFMKIKDALTNYLFKKKRSSVKKVKTNVMNTGSMKLFRYWSLFGFIEGLMLSLKVKPDVIYGYEIYSTNPAKRLANVLKKPSVSRFQGTELAFYLDEPEKFKKAVPYIKGTKVDTDLVIMANDGTQGEKILKELNVNMSKVQFLVNGLSDKERYLSQEKDIEYKRKMGLPNDAIVICTANRFVDWKRVDRILKTMGELVKKNSNYYLIAIGHGPEKEALMELAASLNIKENVIFTGAIDHEKAVYHIANSDLYMTLNHGGNLGNSILEALALGTVVCTLTNPSVEKVLTNKYNSILVETADETVIANKIHSLLNNKDQLKSMEVNARKYARKNLLSWPERMKLEATEVEKLVNTKQ